MPSWAAAQNPIGRKVVRVRRVKAKAVVAPKQPAPQPDPTPPPPPTPEQMPAQPPQVSYLNGQLTIISQNSTLGDILSAVRNRTGAVIEVPPGAATERVAGSMGPGPARDVLAHLLNGSRFDYVMIASPSDPSGVQRVILTPRSGPAAGGNTGENTTVANNQVQQQPQQGNEVPEVPQEVEEQPDTPMAEEPQPEENPDAPPSAMQQDQQQFPQQGTVQPGQPPNMPQNYPGQQPDQQAQPGAPGQPGVKTPEQLLQELQRMQQQQQQQQPQQPQDQP
jgi:hypothetical protein